MPSYDLISDLLDTIESQKFSYILSVIEPKIHNSKEDIIKVFTNLEDDVIDKLIDVLKKSKKKKNDKSKVR